MYLNKDEYRKYQREYHELWRERNPEARSKYQCYRNQGKTRPITSIVELKRFGEYSIQILKITDLKKRKKIRPKEFIGKDRCQSCGIKVGRGYIEKRFYKLKGRKVCEECYEDSIIRKNGGKIRSA